MNHIELMLEPIQDAIRRLENKANDIEWENGDQELVKYIREQVSKMKESNDQYIPLFRGWFIF